MNGKYDSETPGMKKSREEPNILRPDGSLSITVPSDDVTWYDFLANSRIHNSKHGGWNHKSLWNQRSLQRLLTNLAIVEVWTANSLTGKAGPALRTGKFMLKREMSDARLELARQVARQEGRESENWLNVALFQMDSQAVSERFAKRVRFFAYEVPLSEQKSGMLKIDLLGQIDGRELAIVELKKRNGGDSPLMALTEAICYALQLIQCKTNLIRELKEAGVDWDGKRQIHLFLAAPKPYWDKWLEGEEFHDTIKLKRLFDQIVNGLNKVLTAQGEATLTLELTALP